MFGFVLCVCALSFGLILWPRTSGIHPFLFIGNWCVKVTCNWTANPNFQPF